MAVQVLASDAPESLNVCMTSAKDSKDLGCMTVTASPGDPSVYAFKAGVALGVSLVLQPVLPEGSDLLVYPRQRQVQVRGFILSDNRLMPLFLMSHTYLADEVWT
jgi:hypothetical protein